MTSGDIPAPSRRALALPLAFSALLCALGFAPIVRASPAAFASYCGAAALLAIWSIALFFVARGRGQSLAWRWKLHTAHWLQPLAHGSIYLYWGYYWRQVYQSWAFFAGQIAFAYAFDMLLTWSRKREHELGLGVFPIILSTNLFLWFRADWFYWQFAMVAFGFAAKQLLRWERGGRSVHIFNPSSLPLAIASVLLIATGTVGHTWGPNISQNLGWPPYIYQFIFAVSLPGQLMFGVATMTMSAMLTATLLSYGYFAYTGVYYFFGAVPIAVFLGMNLLFTDPATSPRSELGRIVYGILYGGATFALYALLEMAGQLTFYDKLLFVPILNLMARGIDRLVARPAFARFDPSRLLQDLKGRPRNAAWTATWAGIFVCIVALGGAGDSHPGNRLAFWAKACDEGRRGACKNMMTMETGFCDDGSGWACNEVGVRAATGLFGDQSASIASRAFERSCTLGFVAGCENVKAVNAGRQAGLQRAAPQPADYDKVIDGKALPRDRSPMQNLQYACEQGWQSACNDIRTASGAPQMKSPEEYRGECERGDRMACFQLALMYRRGIGVARDDRRAQLCELGLTRECVSGLP